MASQILSNHLAPGGGKVVVLYKPGSASVVNLALSGLAATGETVSEAAISRIFYTGSGQLKIARNTTNVFISGDTDDSFDFVVSLSTDAARHADDLTRYMHCDTRLWEIFDATQVEGTRETRLGAYRQARDQMQHRILELFPVPDYPQF